MPSPPSRAASRPYTRLNERSTGSSSPSLPSELRLLILNAIAREKNPGWASFASVCKEWQAVLATENLRRLELESCSCVEEFGRVMIRQRHLVRHIWLNVQLKTYSCARCSRSEPRYQDPCHSFLDAIRKLFVVLSAWMPGKGLTLELNAYPPSATDHWFKGYHFTTSAVDDGKSEDKNKTPRIGWHDPSHGCHRGRRVENPPEAAILRVFGRIERCFRDHELPRVNVVDCLIIRRQLRRKISRFVLKQLLERLDGLQHFVYEYWRPWQRPWTRRANDGVIQLTEHDLPASLKRLRIFQDFDDDLAPAVPDHMEHFYDEETKRALSVHPAIDAAFALRSLPLEHVSISYATRAQNFFNACLQEWTWHNLQSLALTSDFLRETKLPSHIDDLLCGAGTIALQMPKLRVMALWNGERGNACAFVYRFSRDTARITWRGTWDREFSPCVIAAWQLVASKLCPRPLETRKEKVEDEIRSHGDAIHYLNLPCQVIEPASLWQLRSEGRLPRVEPELPPAEPNLPIFQPNLMPLLPGMLHPASELPAPEPELPYLESETG